MRMLMVAPVVGALVAVALEVPLILAVSWVVPRWVLQRWPLELAQRVGMGVVAFGLLMLAELGLAVLLFGQSAAGFVGGWATLPGALGRAGQIGFAVVPVVQGKG
ncbi:MAG: hypothetical protein H7317_06560 [Pseudorhodobacter sp.]|nr:hypothetical protein [Pseudorhodobacter sp.]